MNKLFYPAIFHVAEDGGFWITFPNLPEWLNEAATAAGVNFSQVLQEALMQKINLQTQNIFQQQKENPGITTIPRFSDIFTSYFY